MPPKKSGGAYGPDPDKKKKSKKEEKKPMSEHRVVLGDSKKEKKLASKLTKKSVIPFRSKKGQKKPETVTKVLLSEAKKEIGKVGGKKELQEVMKKGVRDVEVVSVYTDMLKGKVKGDPVKELDRRSIVAAGKHVEDQARSAAEKKAREEAKEKAAAAAKRKALTRELDIERKVKEARKIRQGARARSTTVKSRNPPPKKSMVVTKGGKKVGTTEM